MKESIKVRITLEKVPCAIIVKCPICGMGHEYFYSAKELYSEKAGGRISLRYCQVEGNKLVSGAYVRAYTD
jgi:hypothetical protein